MARIQISQSKKKKKTWPLLLHRSSTCQFPEQLQGCNCITYLLRRVNFGILVTASSLAFCLYYLRQLRNQAKQQISFLNNNPWTQHAIQFGYSVKLTIYPPPFSSQFCIMVILLELCFFSLERLLINHMPRPDPPTIRHKSEIRIGVSQIVVR